MQYEISTQQFSGPLEKLLELIEAKQFEITTVNLASVTGDFIAYLETVREEINSLLLADFLVVAARLVLIKSKVLLPSFELTEEEERDVRDLEIRLAVYREFAARGDRGDGVDRQSASGYLQKEWDAGRILVSRTFLDGVDRARIFIPSPNLDAAAFGAAMGRLVATLSALTPPEPSRLKSTIVSLKEKMVELVRRCRETTAQSFQGITERRSRPEVIALFLAVLHLFRNRSIDAEQGEQFGDIIIKSKPVQDEHIGESA